MFKLAVILACALVLLTGCNTASGPLAKPVQALPEWGAFPTNERPVQVVVTNPPPMAPPPTIALPPPNEVVIVPVPPKTNPPPPIAPEATWLSLDRWAKAHGLETLRHTALAGGPGFALPTGSGVLTLTPNTPEPGITVTLVLPIHSEATSGALSPTNA